MTKFSDMNFVQPLMDALTIMDYDTPTEIQSQAIPLVLAGHDLLACAQTGTGKTAAFALPLLAKLADKNLNLGSKRPVLILTPTRELAEQIVSVLNQLTMKLRHHKIALVIGGVGYPNQNRALRGQPSFVVATPGRLLDHINQKNINLSEFGTLVLDEADRMLDMGFAPQLDRIVKNMSSDRQTLLFSATLPTNIMKIAAKYLRSPKKISAGEDSTPVERITQNLVQTIAKEKPSVLLREIDKVSGTILIFARTKSRTDQVAKLLAKAGHHVTYIHGDRSQRQRSDAIKGFREGKFRILVATDIAARGLDIPHIEHIINYDLPMVPEDYIHRIGRTARNGRGGNAISLVTSEDRALWSRIYQVMYGTLPRGEDRVTGQAERTAYGKSAGGRNTGGRRSMGGSRTNQMKERAARGEIRENKGERPAFGVRKERGEWPIKKGFSTATAGNFKRTASASSPASELSGRKLPEREVRGTNKSVARADLAPLGRSDKPRPSSEARRFGQVRLGADGKVVPPPTTKKMASRGGPGKGSLRDQAKARSPRHKSII